MKNKELWQIAVELLGEEEFARRFRVWASGVIKKEQARRDNIDADRQFLLQATEILQDLNNRSGRRFTLTSAVKSMIYARMREGGYLVVDFKRVHEVMVSKWSNDEKMRDYLQPSTLYRPSKFDEYLALWYGTQRIAAEDHEKKRSESEQRASSRAVRHQEMSKEEIDKLLARPWHSFDSFREFYLHSLKLPTAEALASYEMPEMIRRMRQAKGMLQKVIMKRYSEYAWAEEEYRTLRDEAKS